MDPVKGSLLFLILSVAYLSPGLLALLAFRPPERASSWLSLAAPIAVLIQLGIECVLKLRGPPLFGATAGLLVTGAVDLALFAIVVFRRRRLPVRTAADVQALVCWLAVPLVFAVVFGEAIFRRELTTDGVEALDMARSLDFHALPRWPSEAGLKGFGQGLIALAFPNAWFLRATGFDGAPRLTFLMFLGVIAAQVLALVESRRVGRHTWIIAAAIAISVLAAGATVGLNVSFDPYFADAGNPAGAEMMTVAMMLAAFVALHERRSVVFLVAAGLAHATLPSGMPFLVVLGATWFVITRSRRALWLTAVAIAICIVGTLLYEKVYVPHALPPGVAMDAGSESLAGRMRLLIFHDFARLAFLVIPCGIVPAFFLLAWKRQDPLSSVATLTTAVLFLFFFVLATYSPHYFAPVMVLALVPYWRWVRTPRAAWIGLAGAIAGLLLSLPHAMAVPQGYHEVAHRIGIPNVGSLPMRVQDLRGPADLLQRLLYRPWEDVDPTRHLVGSGLQLARHALHEADLEPSQEWIVAPEGVPPDGFQPVASQAGWMLLARTGAKMESIRDRGFTTDFQAPWFRVPREALFRVYTERSHRYDLDLRAVFDRFR